MNLPCVSDFDPAPLDAAEECANTKALDAAWEAAAAGKADHMLALDSAAGPVSETLDSIMVSYGDRAILAEALRHAFAPTNQAECAAMAGNAFRRWVESACIAYAADNQGAYL